MFISLALHYMDNWKLDI